MKYDAIVVGSGPAGGTTARYAAENGAKVLILERRAEVGVPVLCAEGVSKQIDKYHLLEGDNWIAASMDGARVYSPDGTMVTLSADVAGAETGYVLHREIFDKEIVRSAVSHGAKVMLNTKVTGLLKENGKITGVTAQYLDEELTISADVIVGADGADSKVGKWAGINTTLKPRDLESCAQYTLTNVNVDEGFCDFYLGKKIAPGGYVWVFPKGKDIANVGIGVLASLSEAGMAKKLLDQFIDTRPDLKKGEPVRFLTGAAPVAEPVETVRDNLILVGDAARHVDPITGGGITSAIEGGKIAGETIAKAVKLQQFNSDVLSAYEQGWKAAFGKKLRRNYVVKEIMLDMDDKTFNMLADSLKDYDFDEISTLGLVKALVAKHPTLLMKLRPLLKLAKK